MDTNVKKKKYLKVLLYIALSIAVFTISILVLPLELFLFTSVIVLVTLRGIEKELDNGDKKDISSIPGN